LASRHETFSVREELGALVAENLYREMRRVEIQGATVKINGKNVIHLCSNDYLGLSRNKQVQASMANALRNGVSQCSSRLIAGSNHMLEKLECELAKQKRFGRVLVYPTGYMANIGVIPALAGKDDLILSDELNHTSIVDACRMCRSEVRVFRHNDMNDLLSKLHGRYRRKVVVTEGVFSMDGDLAMLNEMGKIAHENGALLVLDDAHGDFVYGMHYRGTAEHLHAERYVDILISSMSKALGCFGGYVASSKDIAEYLINRSRSFIYTSALPSAIASGAVPALQIAGRGTMQKKLWRNVKRFRSALMDMGFDVQSTSHIIPIIVKDERLAVSFSKSLLKHGVFVQAIRYPTVPKCSARVRVSITSMLEDHIDDAAEAFRRSTHELNIL
jgi:glycine C-acetyltransferase